MTSNKADSKHGRFQGPFAELLKIEGKLALREPTGLAMGIGFPVILLVIFGIIGTVVPGNVAGTGLTILDIYVPIIMVTGFISLGVSSLPGTLVRYRETGWLRRISTTPTPPSRLLAAQLTLNLIIALVTILIIIFGSEIVFGTALQVSIPYFVLSIVLSIAVLFSLGLVVAALAPSQTVASWLSGGLFFALLLLSGLWIPPSIVGDPLATIMYYSPSGAPVRALLYSAFNSAPPLTAIVTMLVYAPIFTIIAIRCFRWE